MTQPANIEFREGDVAHPQIVSLLETHLATMRTTSPPENVFALDLKGLQKPDVTFWSIWEAERAMCCGALRELTESHGEIKSMHTLQVFRGRGLGAIMLERILGESNIRGYKRLSLETGSHEAFQPAIRLYQRYGFQMCGPFAPYEANPFSLFMTKELYP